MKTIKFLQDCSKSMASNQVSSTITTGTFILHDNKVYFKLNFRPDHIQILLNMGVNVDFATVVMADLSPKAPRFKSGREAIKQGRYAPYYYMGIPGNVQTGVIENRLEATASCNIDVLGSLAPFVRDNRPYEISIHNDTILRAGGWIFKNNMPPARPMMLSTRVAKRLRQKASDSKNKNLLPMQIRAIKQKQYEKK